ncbi:MAG TPA: PEP/pyruvate-binding domain-containing protein [Streptosporangiaceae bacterium]
MTGIQAGPAGMIRGRDHVAVTETCRPEDAGEVGGKAVGLGSLLRAGQRVPPSFVVTAAAYREYVRSRPRALSPAARESIRRCYLSLCERHGTDLVVAVRSSATVEDSAEASWAGQFRTFLGASGADDVIAQVEECWAAALDPRVGAYRAGHRPGDDAGNDGGVAVIVQELVDARSAGVMFTQHPKTGDRSLVVIESSYGLGEAVVGGEVVPDLLEINKITGQRHRAHLGAKQVEHRLVAGSGRGGGVQEVPVDPARQQEWSISEPEVSALAAMAADLEARLGRGLDVEWAIGATGSTGGAEALFALQVRPITVAPPPHAPAGKDRDAIGHILGRLAGRPPESGTG